MHMMFAFRFAVFGLILLTGCLQDRVVDASTQILLSVETRDEALRQELKYLRATIHRKEGNSWVLGSMKSFPRAAISWPVDLPITPGAKSDRAKQFEVVVDALGDDDAILAQARAVSRFLPGERRVLGLLLGACPGPKEPLCDDADCRGGACKVCRSGRCEGVGETDPGELPMQEPDGKPTSFPDGSVEVDASMVGEAGRDGRADSAPGDATVTDAEAEDAADGAPGESTCTTEGALRCPMRGTAQRERCEGAKWIAAEACEAGSVCDATSDPPGSCRELLAVCVGNAGKAVCDGEVMQLCDDQGNSTGMEACETESHCQRGLAAGKCAKCLANEFQCSGAELQVCADDGQGFVTKEQCGSAALCNEDGGKCGAGCTAGSKVCMGDTLRSCKADLSGFEDEKSCGAGLCDQPGQQCDVCVPGTKSCMGNTVRTCNAQGQGYTMQACAAPRGVCTGNGVCVECSASTACPSTGDPCFSSTCDVISGTCKTAVNSRARCAGGVCDSTGNCVGCIDARDCTTSGRPYCSSGQCVQCTATSHCNQAAHEICQDSKCVPGPFCGDMVISRGEECDPKAPGWDLFTCSENCRIRKLYNPCGWHDDCEAGGACGFSYCWYRCSASSPCPQAPVGSGLQAFCNSGTCILTQCSRNEDCPPGTLCGGSAGMTICMGCDDNNLPCPAGYECFKLDDEAGNPTTTGRCRRR